MSLKIIIVVNASPWGSTLSSTAARIADGLLAEKHQLTVFFREDGVYNAVPDTDCDSDVRDLADAWKKMGSQHRVSLLVCQSSAARRLTGQLHNPFRSASLVEFSDLLADCDRVVTF